MASVVNAMRGVSLILQSLRDLMRPILGFSEAWVSPHSQDPLQIYFAYFCFTWSCDGEARITYTKQELFH